MKRIRIESSDNLTLDLEVFESSYQLGQFVWPCSLVLAAYLASISHIISSKSFLELGSGLGIPSIVSGLLGASKCVITERSTLDTIILDNIRQIVKAHSLDSVCEVVTLDWDQELVASILKVRYDYILGSDVFYSTEDFDDILYTVATLFKKNPNAIFLTAYQERSSRRTLIPYLQKYCMKAKMIPLNNFLHHVHEVGQCVFLRASFSSYDEKVILPVPVFDSISLIEITPLN